MALPEQKRFTRSIHQKIPLKYYDFHKNKSRYKELGNGVYWDMRNGDPRITLTIALVMIVTAGLSVGAVHLSQSVKAKRAAANALPSSLVLIDEQGQRTVVSLDAPRPQPAWAIPPQPTEHDFPLAALNAGISGVATVECNFTPTGDVMNCFAIEETPEGYGFGEAASQIVSRGKLTQETVDNGVGSFIVRVPFNLD